MGCGCGLILVVFVEPILFASHTLLIQGYNVHAVDTGGKCRMFNCSLVTLGKALFRGVKWYFLLGLQDERCDKFCYMPAPRVLWLRKIGEGVVHFPEEGREQRDI